MKIQHILEAPIADFKTIGDFEKGSSFRHERDRRLITHPASVENIKKKFGKVSQNINLIFVNTPAANKYTEVGKVDRGWVKSKLGNEVYNYLEKIDTKDAITVIFTNNKGDQRKPMTAWIIAHRMAHALARFKNPGTGMGKQYPEYDEAIKHTIDYICDYIFPAYNIKCGPQVKVSSGRIFSAPRQEQLRLKYFFQAIGTFKSARENKLRDWFEMFNEMFAQYVITGQIKFNPLPDSFGVSGFGRRTYRLNKNDRPMVSEAETALESLAEVLTRTYDDLLSRAIGDILVM